jgi:cation transport ATPase
VDRLLGQAPARRQLPCSPQLTSSLLVTQNDPLVHEHLVSMMDRRLSNVQQHLMRSTRSTSSHGHADLLLGLAEEIGDPAGILRQPQSQRHYDQQEQQHQQYQQNHRQQQHHQQQLQQLQQLQQYQQHQQQQQQQQQQQYQQQQYRASYKRRRATFWEALTGLVCSLGALATRAAKMAAGRSEL